VLVVANLGDAAALHLSISSGRTVLAAGEYAAANLLGGPTAATLKLGQDGQLRGYAPLAGTLGPRESLVLNLVRH